jgi:glutathione S-transferase
MPVRYELHGFWPSGPTYKVGLMLSLCGEAYDYVSLNLRAGEHKAPSFVAMQRYGQVPMLVDRARKRNLCQSAAILDYLAGTIKKFAGEGRDEKLMVREWLFWSFDRLGPPIYRMRGQRLGLRSIHQATAEMYVTEGNIALKVIEDHLKGRKWLVGKGATIADIDIYGVLAYAEAGGYVLANYPEISGWMGRMAKLKGFGSSDKLLPKESRAAS